MRLSALTLPFVSALALAVLGCGGASEAVKHYNAGAKLAEQSRWEEAIKEYDEAIRLDPKDAVAYNSRGRAYSELGQHPQAIQDYDEAIRLDPKDALAYHNRGLAYSEMGHYEQAIQDLNQAIRLNPNDAMPYNDLARTYAFLHTLLIKPVPATPSFLQVGTPITLFAVPGARPPMWDPIAVASERGLVPFTNTEWRRLPIRSIPVQQVILLPNAAHVGVPVIPWVNHPSFQGACESCWSEVRLDINPEYAEKMMWEGVKIIATAVTIPHTLKLLHGGDLMTLWDVVKLPPEGQPDVAGAKFAIWVAAKTAGIPLGIGAESAFGDVGTLGARHIGGLVRLEMERALGVASPQPSWSYRVTKFSGGALEGSGGTVRWISSESKTYRGIFPTDGWSSIVKTKWTESPGRSLLPGPAQTTPRSVYVPPPPMPAGGFGRR